MNHQAIIEQLSVLAPKLKAAESPEAVLVKYASDRNLAPAQLERIGQVYNIAKTLNFMDKSANRGDSFRVLDTNKMMSDFTSFKPKQEKEATNNTDWNNWFDAPLSKAASTSNPNDINSWIDYTEKSAKIVEEDGQYTVYSEDGDKKLSKSCSIAANGRGLTRCISRSSLAILRASSAASSMICLDVSISNLNAVSSRSSFLICSAAVLGREAVTEDSAEA